jgi:hypothetical protein
MLNAGLIVAGWDAQEGGSVYALPLGGTLVKVPFAIGGKISQRFGCLVVCLCSQGLQCRLGSVVRVEGFLV